MSPSKKSTTTSPPQHSATHCLKHRVITCLNKLSDRDTISVATAELESIAGTLTPDLFAAFLNCLHNTDASTKSPVRKQCVNLLTLLSRSHGNSLSPHLPKMISTVLRRLRDPDSAIRSACAAAAASMAANITKPSFSSNLLKPLIESLVFEQEYNAQIGGALCLAAAIEAAPEVEAEPLQKILPRLGKLVRSEGFKAKPALLVLIGSAVGVKGVSSKGLMDWLVPCTVEFLGNEDWAVRKAAAELLGKVAVVESELAAEYKAACVNSLEIKRFDKVKVVRETMNRTLELWKEISRVSEEVTVSSQSKSSSIDNVSDGCFPLVSKRSHDVGFRRTQMKKTVPTSRSPPSDSSFVSAAKKTSPLNSNDWNSCASLTSRRDHKKSDQKIVIAIPQSPSSKVDYEDDFKRSDPEVLESGEIEKSGNSRPETKRVLFSKIYDEKIHKFGGSRYGSRVVPFPDNDDLDSAVIAGNNADEAYDNHKDIEDLSLIRDQLLQIENRQSSLLDLLQRFIGSSQSGINSLETRVHGLEMALDEISFDLALSSGRIPNTDSAENTCCKLPGAEFLSPKFWRKTEGWCSSSRFSSRSIQSACAMHNMSDKDASTATYTRGSQRFHPKNTGLVMNPSADVCRDSRRNLCLDSVETPKNIIQDSKRIQILNSGGIDGASPAARTAPPLAVNLSSRR